MIGDLDRKIVRIVLLLASSDGRFEDRDAQVFRCDDGVGLKRIRLTPDLRELLVGRGLVEIDAGTIRLTASGRACAATLSGHPQAYRLQHGAISAAPESLSGNAPGALIDDAESPLAWLHRRKSAGGVPMVDDAEFSAGERLRLDFTKGGMMPSVTSNWREMAGSGGGGRGGRADMTDAALAARDRVTAALQALDPELAGVAIDVCCFLKGLEMVESDRQWPQRSAKVVLKMALRALVRHYGIAVEAVGSTGKGLQHWGSEDYRPKVSDGR
jgi:hypothetical protein